MLEKVSLIPMPGFAGETGADRTASYFERCRMEVSCGDCQVQKGAVDGRYAYMYDIEVQADR